MDKETMAQIRASEPENSTEPRDIIERLVRALEKWAQLDEDEFDVEGMPEEVTPAYDAGKAFLGECYTTADGFYVDPRR